MLFAHYSKWYVKRWHDGSVRVDGLPARGCTVLVEVEVEVEIGAVALVALVCL